MADNTVEAMIRLEWERASQSRLQRGLATLSDSLKKTFARDAPSAINQTTDALAQQNKQLEKNKKTLESYNDQFDKVNNDVGLAGDAASNLSTVGSVIGGDAGGAIGAGAGLLEVVEALPRLKASLSAMPQVIGAAASALGPVGLGLGAVALAAAVAFQRAADQINAAKAGLAATIEAEKNVSDFVLQGSTSTDARARIEKLREDQAAAQVILDQNRQRLTSAFAETQRDLTNSHIGVFGDLVARAGVATGAWSDLQASVDSANSSVLGAGAEIRELEQALNDNAFAANDAAEKLRQEAAAKLQAADIVADELQREQRALNSNTEQNEARLKQIEDERAVLNEQLAVLKAGSATSEEVTKRIEQLTRQLNALGEEARFITEDALPTQRDKEAAQKRIDDAKKAREKAEKEADKSSTGDLKKHYEDRAKLEKEHQDNLIAIVDKAADAAEKAATKLEYDLADALTDAQQERAKVMLTNQRNEAKELRDHARNLLKIQKDAQQQEKDLLFDQDFRGIFELRQKTTDAMFSAQDDFSAAADERKIAFNHEIEDLRTALDQRRAELQLSYEREEKQREQDKQAALIAEQQKQRERLQTLHAAAAQEISLVNMTEQQKAQIFQNALNVITSRGTEILNNLSSRFQSGQMNQSRTMLDSARDENQSLKSRPASSGSSGVQVNVYETTNPQKTAKLVNQKLSKLLYT